ncbi:NAD-binding protein [Nonomuraea sp. NPDC049758]|uniref:NAD-binding protein n=1 Tax=Nonomuraea sp. NPDC049758 TaxID=3154360 RepID=UPI003445329A
MADKNRDPVVVIGLGRFGSSLALELTRRGTEVLAGEITHIATADTTNMAVLRQLGVPESYRAVVAIGGDIQASILTHRIIAQDKRTGDLDEVSRKVWSALSSHVDQKEQSHDVLASPPRSRRSSSWIWQVSWWPTCTVATSCRRPTAMPRCPADA